MNKKAEFKKGDLVFMKRRIEYVISGDLMQVMNVTKRELNGGFYARVGRKFWVREDKLILFDEAIELLKEYSENKTKTLLNQLKYQYKTGKKIAKLEKAIRENIPFEAVKDMCKQEP